MPRDEKGRFVKRSVEDRAAMVGSRSEVEKIVVQDEQEALEIDRRNSAKLSAARTRFADIVNAVVLGKGGAY